MIYYLEYVQPSEELRDNEGTFQIMEVIRIEIHDAIRLQKAVGLRNKYVYKTDKDALYDAIATNWATLIEEERDKNDRNTVVVRRISDVQEDLLEKII